MRCSLALTIWVRLRAEWHWPGMWVRAPLDQMQALGGVFLLAARGAPCSRLDLQSFGPFIRLLASCPSVCLSSSLSVLHLLCQFICCHFEPINRAEGHRVDISHTGLGATLMTSFNLYRLSVEPLSK